MLACAWSLLDLDGIPFTAVESDCYHLSFKLAISTTATHPITGPAGGLHISCENHPAGDSDIQTQWNKSRLDKSRVSSFSPDDQMLSSKTSAGPSCNGRRMPPMIGY